MTTKVTIPAMGESISSGILAAWNVKDGDYVEEGQAIYELETDKITSEANAEVSGTIKIKVAVDEEVEIGQLVATIDESASAPAPQANSEDTASSTDSKPDMVEENAASTKQSSETDALATTPSTKNPEEPKNIVAQSNLSPAARKAAKETGADISLVKGSGKDGRITKHDILSHELNDEAVSAKIIQLPPSAAHSPLETRKRMTPLRKKIAEHLVHATQEAAMLTTFNEVDMSAVLKLRKQYQEDFVAKYGIKLGFMSFFAKATTHALQAVPTVNARIEGDEVVTQHYYDIGVAVGTDKGLMVPVIRDCAKKNFAQIEQSIANYAKLAREGKIQMSDLQGGVFTISNGGIYGSMLSTPIINHPQPAILGLHNIQQRAVVIDGEIMARPMMYLALSYDHRLIDGKEAVTFLVKIKEAIENPNRLLFGI
ncbi:MAG: 2-oxoglutarate dehydrogenase complex dihydrolipoyllysine-residue succinyltransferase [Verrucomicrobiota bacterium]|nr:2-oxoglutarate dehydrogenase complex dihydrolipoyllysine-residue succinyltransferase [Verrucomicrobiota bacterium]